MEIETDLNEVICDNKVYHVHDEFCKNHDTCKDNCYNSPWFYEFQFLYETHKALVYPCVNTYNGTPHSFVLENAVKQIKKERGIKTNRFYEVNISRSSFIQSRLDYGKKNKTVVEAVSFGGFNATYYVEHEISDLDVDGLLNQEVKLWSLKWNNLYHLARVISVAKSNILVKMLSKEDKKKFNKINKRYL